VPLCSGGICLVYIEVSPSRVELWKLIFVSETGFDFLTKFTKIKQALIMLWSASLHSQPFAVIFVFGRNLLRPDSLSPLPNRWQFWNNKCREKNHECYEQSGQTHFHNPADGSPGPV
jgi:hypothetical protein